MRFVELRQGGDRAFVLDFHPQLTLLAGLGGPGRRWMASLLAGALRGDLRGLQGKVEVHGVERELTEALIAELQLTGDVDVVVRPMDLPGARTIDARNGEAPTATAVVDLSDQGPDVRTIANELSEARHALDRASEARTDVERLLQAAREALAPEAADATAVEARLEEARARRARAAAAVEAAVQAQPSDERREAAAARARLGEQRAELERRRADILEALDGLPNVDPGPVAAALAEVRSWVPDADRPDPEALRLADELAVVGAELELLPHPPSPPAQEVTAAEAEIERWRVEVRAAEEALNQRQVSPEDARRIDELHDEVLDAEDKAERRLAPPAAKKRLQQAREAESTFLRQVGFSSYSDYLLTTSTMIVDPGAPGRLLEARAALADAETAWSQLVGEKERAARRAAEEREVELLKQARDVLGTLPDDGVEDALRAIRPPVAPPDYAELESALDAVGARDLGGNLLSAADRFLADADEAHAQRAMLQAELSSVTDDLTEVAAALDALPPAPAHDESDAALEAARAELQRASDEEQDAQRAVVLARNTAAEHRSTLRRIDALQADVAGASAAEQQAAARVAQLEQRLAEAEGAIERRRRARQEAAERSNAAIDLREVERVPTEVYLLARVAAQREVGQAGSLPLIIGDALSGLTVDTTQGVLDVIERFSPFVQMIVMSDDPEIEEWVRSFGDAAAVRRFSLVSA